MVMIAIAAVALSMVSGRKHNHGITGACIQNLKLIQGAKQTWELEHHNATNEIPTDLDLFGENALIRRKPECPIGGTYTIGRIGEAPRCSIQGHRL